MTIFVDEHWLTTYIAVMARTKTRQKPPQGKQIGIRVNAEMIAWLDAEVTRQVAERPGARVGYSEVIRTVLFNAFSPEKKGS